MNKRIVSVVVAALLMMSSSAMITASADEPGKSPETTIVLDSGDWDNYEGVKSPHTGVAATPGLLPLSFAIVAALCTVIGVKKSSDDE